jgi:hypothetical protein
MGYVLTPTGMIDFLREASRYFANRPTGGEDSAYWANVKNSSNCTAIADWIENLQKGVVVK